MLKRVCERRWSSAEPERHRRPAVSHAGIRAAAGTPRLRCSGR